MATRGGGQRLIDKSAVVRLADSLDAAQWAARIERGLVRITTATEDIGYWGPSEVDARSMVTTPPVSAMPVEYLTSAPSNSSHCRLTPFRRHGRTCHSSVRTFSSYVARASASASVRVRFNPMALATVSRIPCGRAAPSIAIGPASKGTYTS